MMEFSQSRGSSISTVDGYFSSYADFKVHRIMLEDKPRMEFYKKSLSALSIAGNKTALEGKLVMDLGAGSGILSMFAVRDGHAGHVLAVEASEFGNAILRENIAENNLENHITIINNSIEYWINRGIEAFFEAFPIVQQYGHISAIISEWMGFYLFHEGMLLSVIRARDFCTRVNQYLSESAQNGDGKCSAESNSGLSNNEHTTFHDDKSMIPRMIPDVACLYAAPVQLRSLYETGFSSFWGKIDDRISLASMGCAAFEFMLNANNPVICTVPSDSLLHEESLVVRLDLQTVAIEDILCINHTLTFNFSTSPYAKHALLRREKALQHSPSDLEGQSKVSTKISEDRVISFGASWMNSPEAYAAIHGVVLWFDVFSSVYDAKTGNPLSTYCLSTSPKEGMRTTHWEQCLIVLPLICRQSNNPSLVEFMSESSEELQDDKSLSKVQENLIQSPNLMKLGISITSDTGRYFTIGIEFL